MKIAFVVDDSLDSNDGVQQYVRTLGTWLVNNGHSVRYISSTAQKSSHVYALSKTLPVRFNKNSLKIPLPASMRKIHQILVSENFDIVHIQMPFSPQLSGRLIKGLQPQTGLVGTFHIMPYGRLQTLGGSTLAWLTRPSLKRFDQIISVSKPAQAHAKQTYSIDSVVIPNSVNTSLFTHKAHVKAGRIVYLGRLVPRKGCLELLKAVKLLSKTSLSFEVIIAGDGPERSKLEAYTKRHKLSGHVRFEGRVSETRKRQLLESGQIAVFPSLGGESFGIVLIEAMAAGSEVVLAGSNPGYSSVLQHVPDSLFEPKRTAEFANKLEELLNDAVKRSGLHLAQQNLVKQFDITRVGPQIVKVYETVIEK